MNAAVNGISTITEESRPTIQSMEINTTKKLLEANSIIGSEKVCKIPASVNPPTKISNDATKNIILQSILCNIFSVSTWLTRSIITPPIIAISMKSLKDAKIGLTMRQSGLGKSEWIKAEKKAVSKTK